MITNVQKWGNSLAVRIPKALAEDLPVREGDRVNLTVENGSLSVAPVVEESFDLDSLLDGVTAGNLHAEVDHGRSEGREVW